MTTCFEKKVWLSSPTMHGEEIKYVTEAYETNWMSTVGANINEVERLAAEKIGCKYAVALSAGTAALHLCTKLAGEALYGMPKVGEGALRGHKVFCSDMTFDATVNPIAYESGEAITYGLFNAQERGPLFIGPGTKVYAGMVIGQSGKSEDVEVNVCKTKKLTNTRSSSADEALKLVPPRVMSLEQCLEFIDTDELLEVTPENLRIRKKILDPMLRKRDMIRQKQLAANAAQG